MDGISVVATPLDDCSYSDDVTLEEGTDYSPDCSWEVNYTYLGEIGVFFTINTDNAVQTAAVSFLALLLT